MLVQLSFALLLQADPSFQPRLAGIPFSANAITDAAGYAVLRFLSTWRTAWLQSVEYQGYGHTDIRLRDDHCHWDGSYSPRGDRGYYRPPSVIHNSSRRSMCPNWFPSDEPTPFDERVSRDASLTPDWRERVRTARDGLLDSLETLDKLKPGDAWITGERVRFLVDQRKFDSAIDVARACTADRVWCQQLKGFAYDAAGDYTRADSAFDAASAGMTPEKRCEWTSTATLLDNRGRSAYEHLSCDERVAMNERLWWLATPLFSDSSGDRRSADFSRKVLIQLHSALPWDERYDWRHRFGGEALSEMLVRYGWPAFSAFGGSWEEMSHASWMGFYDSTRTATAEYPQDRLHLFPDWRAVDDPFHAPADAWQINMPALAGDDEPAAQWWPAEHYARAAGGIRQLSDQTVMLRRDGHILMATASELPTGRYQIHPDTAGTVLVRTTGPRDVQKIPHDTYTNDRAIVLTAAITSKPAIVGTELTAAKKESPQRARGSASYHRRRSPRSRRVKRRFPIRSFLAATTDPCRALKSRCNACSDPRECAAPRWACTGRRTVGPPAIRWTWRS